MRTINILIFSKDKQYRKDSKKVDLYNISPEIAKAVNLITAEGYFYEHVNIRIETSHIGILGKQKTILKVALGY